MPRANSCVSNALVVALAASLSGCAAPGAEAPGAVEPAAPRPGGSAAGEVGAEVSPARGEDAATDAPPAYLTDAVSHADRPEEDRARDADRLPARVLELAGVQPGMTVLDLMAGRGYYTEIVARAVGPGGRVLCQNSPFVLQRFAEGPLSERLARPGMENVVRVDQDLDALELEPESMNVALMVLFYHDTVWQQVNRAEMNRRIFEALAPGGVFLVVDHRAEPNSGDRDVKTLHRVDPEIVRREILSAGFALGRESDLLARPEDDHARNVFEDDLRGKTDRFVFRFEKP